jgi:hypothetical protein
MEIPYDKMFDFGQRMYPKVPLMDGSTAMHGHLMDLKFIADKAISSLPS